MFAAILVASDLVAADRGSRVAGATGGLLDVMGRLARGAETAGGLVDTTAGEDFASAAATAAAEDGYNLVPLSPDGLVAPERELPSPTLDVGVRVPPAAVADGMVGCDLTGTKAASEDLASEMVASDDWSAGTFFPAGGVLIPADAGLAVAAAAFNADIERGQNGKCLATAAAPPSTGLAATIAGNLTAPTTPACLGAPATVDRLAAVVARLDGPALGRSLAT